MIKRALVLILTIALCFNICSCAKNEGENTNTKRNDPGWSLEAKENMNATWFFVPENCTINALSELDKELGVSFKGCSHDAINEYAEELYNAITRSGFEHFDVLFDMDAVKVTEFIKGEKFKKCVTDEYFYGKAYTFKYHNGENFYELVIEYFGSAGGKEINALCTVTLFDRTEDYKPYYEEINK